MVSKKWKELWCSKFGHKESLVWVVGGGLDDRQEISEYLCDRCKNSIPHLLRIRRLD